MHDMSGTGQVLLVMAHVRLLQSLPAAGPCELCAS